MKAWGALVLAGGKSSRFGSDKALLNFKGTPLIRRVVDEALKVSSILVVSLGKGMEAKRFKAILPSEVKLVRDRFEGRGPLEGLRQGFNLLSRLNVKYALALACDLPYLKAEVLRFMLEEAERLEVEALVPRWPNGFTEALHSVYQPAPMAKACQEALQSEESLIMDAVKRLRRVHYLNVERLRILDPNLQTFTNINTPADLEAALKT